MESDNVVRYLLFGYWTTFEKSVIITWRKIQYNFA